MIDLQNLSFALKEHYTPERVREMIYKNNPLHALLPKYEDFTGKNLPTPVKFGNPQSRSANFVTAQNQALSSQIQGKSFVMTSVRDYAVANLDAETMLATKNDVGSFLRAATEVFDGAIHSITRSAAVAEYGDGSGSIGIVDAEPTVSAGSFSIQLDSPESVTNFEVGMSLQIYPPSSTTPRTSDGTQSVFSIVAVNRDTGVLTLSGSYSASGNIDASDRIMQQGDLNSKISGLAAWLPWTAPVAGDNFFGVDRSSDVTRLSGQRYDASGVPIEEALQQAIRRLEREGGQATHCFMNFNNWAKLQLSLGSKVLYGVQNPADAAHIGFRSILIQGSRGLVNVIADQNCPDNLFYLLQMDTWELFSRNAVPHTVEDDGLPLLRLAAADGVEGRYRYFANMRCFAPGWNLVGKLY